MLVRGFCYKLEKASLHDSRQRSNLQVNFVMMKEEARPTIILVFGLKETETVVLACRSENDRIFAMC